MIANDSRMTLKMNICSSCDTDFLEKTFNLCQNKSRVEVAIVSTIKDIAKAAGVSIATVSIVLNGKGRERKISQETQQRIYKIAQDLNYVPNQSAKKLRSAKKTAMPLPSTGQRTSVSTTWPASPLASRKKS